MIWARRALVSLRTEDGDGQTLHLTHAGAGPLRLRRICDSGDALAASFRMVRCGCFGQWIRQLSWSCSAQHLGRAVA